MALALKEEGEGNLLPPTSPFTNQSSPPQGSKRERGEKALLLSPVSGGAPGLLVSIAAGDAHYQGRLDLILSLLQEYVFFRVKNSGPP